MKFLTKFHVLLIASMIIFSYSCNPLKDLREDYSKVKVESSPEVMEVHADSIDMEIKGEIPEDYIKSDAVIKYTPTLVHKKGDTALEDFYIKGKEAKISDPDVDPSATIPEDQGGTFSHDFKIPYKPTYKESRLDACVRFKIESEFDSLDQCSSPSITDSITAGAITTSLTVKPFDDVLIAGVDPKSGQNKYTPGEKPGDLEGDKTDVYRPQNNTRNPKAGVIKPANINQKGTINFEIDRHYIRESEKDGEAMRKIREFAQKDNLVISGVVINSYASPDGELENNAELTRDRAESTYEYLKDELEKLGHESVHDSDFYRKASTKEDWSGFQRLVQQSDLDQKDEILNIANSNMALDEKEQAIRDMDVWEPYMVDTLLPKLRRSDIDVKGFLRVRPQEKVETIAEEKGLDSLHRKELIKLAYNSNNIERKREIYQHYTERYPDNWVGHNNLKALLLFEGRYKQAQKAFEKLDEQYPDNAYIQNNLGVANRHMNDYSTARENYLFAKQKKKDERNNLGILDIKVADYESSVENFEDNRCDYNVALAYTLKEDYDKALDKIECITNKTADVFYLRAIVGARKDDADLMTTSLRRALEMDENIRERAKNDLEFRDYHGTPEFKNALRY